MRNYFGCDIVRKSRLADTHPDLSQITVYKNLIVYITKVKIE